MTKTRPADTASPAAKGVRAKNAGHWVTVDGTGGVRHLFLHGEKGKETPAQKAMNAKILGGGGGSPKPAERSAGAYWQSRKQAKAKIDAAKFFRDRGIGKADLEHHGIPMKERVATEGVALANLHETAFKRVVDGTLTPARGAIIGGDLTHAQQKSLLTIADRHKPTDATLREMVTDAKLAPTAKVKTNDLFGENEEDISLALHRGEAVAHVKDRLGKEKRVFGTVAKGQNAKALAKGGNTIDVEQSGAISKAAAENLQTFELLRGRRSPVSELLNEAAERIHKGEKKKAVHDEIYKRLPEAVRRALDGE